MTIKSEVQEAIKQAMKSKNTVRLECLRMAKAALLLKEKSAPKDQALSDEDAIQTLRAEVKKRQQTVETYQQLNKPEEAAASQAEIDVLEEFLPKQLTEAQLTERVQAFLAANPDVNHPGKLTGAMKKELGDLADGKMLNQVCQKALAD